MSVLIPLVDKCGEQSTPQTVSECATPAKLATINVPAVRVIQRTPQALRVLIVRVKKVVTVLLGRGKGRIEVRTTPSGYTFVVRSLSGNVFVERKFGFGSHNVTIHCRKAGRGVCPRSGNLSPRRR
jgi:hypothetical protein